MTSADPETDSNAEATRGAKRGSGDNVPLPDIGGLVAGRYRVLSSIARGGMGVVFEARDEATERIVAVKILPPFASVNQSRERFLRECRTTAAIQHPRVIRIYDAGFHRDALPFFAMERLYGLTLRARLKRHGPLSVPLALRVTSAVCSALSAAHAAGVLHRDVKPGNVFLREQPIGVVLFDFGLSLDGAYAARLTDNDIVVGTPAYMSPEQVVGDPVDERADVYGAGTVLYQALVARRHLAHGLREVPAVFDAILDETPAPPSSYRTSIPAEVDALVAKALEKKVSLRFQSAAEMREALDELAEKLERKS